MTETRAITFGKLKENCAYSGDEQDFLKGTLTIFCFNDAAMTYGLKCTAANCPIWKGLKEKE